MSSAGIAPITPPISPAATTDHGHSDHAMSMDTQEITIVPVTEKLHYRQQLHLATPEPSPHQESFMDVEDDEYDVDVEPGQHLSPQPELALAPAPPPRPLSPLRPPLRQLSDEQIHIHRRGTLRLIDFEVKETLGTGTFARVLLVRLRHNTSDQVSATSIFAMKVLRKSELVRQRQVEHVIAERYILSRVHHPFIVDLYATFQDHQNIYMLLSYVPGGELFTHLRRAGRFTPDVTRFYLAGIILALKYLHSFNIIYRDLKPENLLLDSRGYLRLTDFGFAKIIDDRTWTLCGTPEYLAPEIIQNDGHGKAADWWACGVLAYEMVVGYPPFFDDTAYGIYEKILAGKINWPNHVDYLSREIIEGFLNPDRSKRLGNMKGGPEDVLNHPWFRGVDWGAVERREIRAPIIPPVTSSDDTRHFGTLPLPPVNDIPGLYGPPITQSLEEADLLNNQFNDF